MDLAAQEALALVRQQGQDIQVTSLREVVTELSLGQQSLQTKHWQSDKFAGPAGHTVTSSDESE